MKEYTKLTNSLYASRTPFELLINKRYPGASFAVFDVNTLLTNVYNNPAEFFTAPFNVTGPFHQCDATGTVCVNQAGTLDQYMWYDDLHPSQRTDEIIATEFVKVVKGTSTFATYWS
jgi:phospholipase/lecithinase/hemolysin